MASCARWRTCGPLVALLLAIFAGSAAARTLQALHLDRTLMPSAGAPVAAQAVRLLAQKGASASRLLAQGLLGAAA